MTTQEIKYLFRLKKLLLFSGFTGILAVMLLALMACSSIPGLDPKPTMSWEKRLDSQMIFASAPNYNWNKQSKDEVRKIMTAVLEAGADGVSIEMCTRNLNFTLADYYKNNKLIAEVWMPLAREFGLIIHFAYINTNTDANNRIKDSDWKLVFNDFFDRCGTKNMIVLAASEEDKRTRPSIRATLKMVLNSRLPERQRVTHWESGQQIVEYHSKNGNDTKKSPLGRRFLVVPDSCPAIGYMYNGPCFDTTTPKPDNIASYAGRVAVNGNSTVVNYNFCQKFDYVGLKAAMKTWGKR